MAECLTRFFAGTVIALRLSARLLGVTLIPHFIIVAALGLAPMLGMKLYFSPSPAESTFQGFYFVFTFALIFALQWMSRQIVNRFREVRLKEAETVYHAFYLHSARHLDEAAKRDQTVLRETLRECLRNLIIG